MITVKIVVGVYTDLADIKESVSYQLPQLPSIGDIILPNAMLNSIIERKRREWEFNLEERINFVRAIAFSDNGTPIVMLGIHPTYVLAELYFKGEYKYTCLPEVPSIDSRVKFDESNSYWVRHVCFYPGDSLMLVVLGDEFPDPR